MTASSGSDEFRHSTSEQPPSCRCDEEHRCEDCRQRTLDRVIAFATEKQQAAYERAMCECEENGTVTVRQEQVIEDVASEIADRIVIDRATRFCRRTDLEATSLERVLALFDLEEDESIQRIGDGAEMRAGTDQTEPQPETHR